MIFVAPAAMIGADSSRSACARSVSSDDPPASATFEFEKSAFVAGSPIRPVSMTTALWPRASDNFPHEGYFSPLGVQSR